ncbi:Beta-ketoacyl synthase [Apiospora hydei]|uniref:Beta-ketoacyl synthase n=1 Tax=Apiospora hydei TaxID=1337664 RepID=A0ABR1VW54_9PEZI
MRTTSNRECHIGLGSEPVAIIGMSSKFAGDATNTDKLWRMLIEGRSGWTPFPSSRFNLDGVYHPNNERLNSTHVKGAHFLEEDVGLFDAAFFSYSSETSSSLDPQYRLQLESVYEALENAGLPLASIAGSNTSVFTGVFVHDYRDALLRSPDALPRLMATGTGVPMMSNRISHFFDLRGASMTIETACSSGMVAMHQAIQSLRTGEADMAIVGCANLTLNPDMFKALGSAGFLSGDGKSYAFDSRASGYGRGEGVSTVVVKLLKDALAAGDPIQAVIRESLLNQDGKTETITTPSLQAQEALIRGCYAKAGLDPRDTQYFEAHGTGTQAGDTIEAQAIASVFGSRTEPLLIGSIKTNIGHTEAASGLASIIKTALALKKGVIPPTINFEKPNPKLSLEDWNLSLVSETTRWPETPVRRASINNFGYGGTNAHIIMEDAASWTTGRMNTIQLNGYINGDAHTLVTNGSCSTVNGVESPDGDSSRVLVLSGKDEQACQTLVSRLGDFLEQELTMQEHQRQFLDSLVFTLGQRRTRFPWVAAHPVTGGIDAVVQGLRSPKFKPTRSSSAKPRIGMVFTGQGAQWYTMGRELVDTYPVYGESLREAEGYLKEFGATWSLVEELSRGAEVSRISEVALSTPICVAVQISLVRLLRAWGVVPTAVTSHSSGEIAAAYAAGALSYRKAMSIAYHRAALAANPAVRGPAKGGMIAVGLGQSDTEVYLKRLVSGKAIVACINSPSSTTVAGDMAAVVELEDLAKADGVFARRLKVDTAWHSHHMAPVASAYAEELEADNQPAEANTVFDEPVAFSSPVTGGRMASSQDIANPQHWIDSLLQPVQFVAAFTDMVLGDGGGSVTNVDVIVEVGPHTALGGPIQEILGLPEFEGLRLPYYGSLVRKSDARETMRALAANLLRHGCAVDLGAVNFPFGRGSHVEVLTSGLPTYPWNHKIRHWVEPRQNRALRQQSLPPHDLLGSLVEGCNPETPLWRHFLRISETPWTRDHMIQSNVVYPAAGYICLAIEAIRQARTLKTAAIAGEVTGYCLRDVEFMQALLIPDSSDGIEVQTTMRPVDDKAARAQGWTHFEVWTVTSDNEWTQHAKGSIMVEYDNSSFDRVDGSDVPRDIEGYARRFLPGDLFANLRTLGISHGPLFQNMTSIIQSGSERRSVVAMTVPDTLVPNDLPRDHLLHPVYLDSVITAPYSAMPEVAGRETAAKVPRAVESFWVSAKISNKEGHAFKASSSIIHDDDQDMKANVMVFDHEDGRPVLEMRTFSYQSLGRALSLQKREPWQDQWCNSVQWSLDVSIASPATFDFIKSQLSSNEVDLSEVSLTESIRRVCVGFMQKALRNLDPQDVQRLEPHHAKYYLWMKDVVEKAASGKLCDGSTEWLADDEVQNRRLINQVAHTRGDGEMVCHLGPHLAAILRGETTPLEVMTRQEGLLARYQTGTPKLQCAGSQLAGLLRHLTHKNPRSHILEVGAGYGTMTRYALDALGTTATGGPLASSYHFTDVSDRTFEVSREIFADWSDLLSFDLLDIERDPSAQGFSDGSYDLIIASHVLFGAKNADTLGNIRRLLKPGGAVLVVEDVHSRVDNDFVNGLLPGWQFGEEHMNYGQLCRPRWDESLRNAGFTGIDLELHDHDGTGDYTTVLLMSTAVPTEPAVPSPRLTDPENTVIVVSERAGAPPSAWLEKLRHSLSSRTQDGEERLPALQDLESDSATSAWYAGKTCIFVGEMDEPILYDLDATYLEGIRAMSTGCQGLLWVTRGGAVGCERPEMSLATGFVRTLRTEYVGRKFLTLDLNPQKPLWSEEGLSTIVQVMLQSELGKSSNSGAALGKGPVELEYAERDGVILIPRLYHDIRNDQMMSRSAHGSGDDGEVATQNENTVLACGDHEKAPVLPRRTAAELSANASYLIVGGSGGLGQSVAHWLVSHGARNLILMSRNAAKSQHTAALAEELRRAGCYRVLPVSCDVASQDDLARAIHMCAREGMPPIRGVIHAAFVLRDSFVESMTLDDYKFTTESKVAGAWNLHNQFNLPGDLDFFILFSSINGILGYPSQAAYSAAGAYEDALAHWRVKQCGLPAVSIDLSVVNGVGYVAEASAAEMLRKTLVRAGRRVIGEDHVLAALESAVLSPHDPQFVVGGINSGPGPHWDVDGDLGRDMRLLPLQYRKPSATDEQQQQQDGGNSLAARMAACGTREEAIGVVGSAMADMLADMFLVPVEEIDLAQSPAQQGVDSLVAVEVRNMLFSQAAAELSIFNVMQVTSLAILAAEVVDRSAHVNFDAV